ncbi:MAG: hypothetical protein ACOY93_21680 [Bacillota bacterium]
MAEKAFDPNEREFMAEVGLHPDQLERLAAEAPALPEAVRERIRSRVHQRVQAPAERARPALARTRWQWAAAAGLLLAVGVTALFSTSATAQEILKRLVRVIPGVGLAPTDEESLLLRAPVQVAQGDLTATVTALFSNGTETRVRVSLEGLPEQKWKPGERPAAAFHEGVRGFLLLPDGRRLIARQWSGKTSNGTVQLDLVFGPLPAGTPAVQLELMGLPDQPVTIGELALELIPSGRLPLAREGGKSSPLHGITVAVPHFALEEDTIRLHLQVEGPEGEVAVAPPWSLIQFPAVYLTDDAGRPYELRRHENPLTIGAGRSTLEFAFDGPLAAGARSLRVAVPSLLVTLEGSATLDLSLDQLAEGQSLTVDRDLQIGDLSLHVERVTRLGERRLEVEYRATGRELAWLLINGPGGSFTESTRPARPDGLFKAVVELREPPAGSGLRLVFSHPVVRTPGPWVVELPLSR